MKRDYVFTSASVTEGHPDKLSDTISDAIVDEYLRRDPCARITAECAVAKGVAFIAARFASTAVVDMPTIARNVIHEAGYESGPFNARDCAILTGLSDYQRSECLATPDDLLSEPDIERLTVENHATLFGVACTQTPALMPLPIWLANRLARRLTAARLLHQLAYLAPDGKVQVGVEYRDRRAARIFSVALITSQNEAAPELTALRNDIVAQVIEPVFAQEELRPDADTRIDINPHGAVFGGGPAFHSGLTGRKTGADTYGEYSRQSGSALSGKDPLRVDRIGAYAARYAAKNVVAAGLAEECEVQLSYAIGLTRPVSVQVETFGTGRVDDEEITRRLVANIDFRPGGILRRFRLRQLPSQIKGGFYKRLACYGQMGRMDMALPWEATDLTAVLRG